MCALLGEKTHISRNKITENEQKDVKRTQNYRKKKQNHQKTTENNEYRRNNTLFVVFCMYKCGYTNTRGYTAYKSTKYKI